MMMSLCIISMIFQHFAHSILLMMFLHFVPQFITVDLYFFNTASLLTLEFHIFALSTCNQGQFLPIKISGDMHVTTSCCLTVRISNQIAYILQMARSNALTCIYSGTTLLNSYSPFERPLSWQIMSASHQNET